MPADSEAVMVIDLLAFSDVGRLEVIGEAFDDQLIAMGVGVEHRDVPEYFASLRELEVDPLDDLAPWMGRSVAVAVDDLEGDSDVANPSGVEFIVAIESRNRVAAEAFLERWLDNAADEGIDVDEDSARDYTAWDLTDSRGNEMSVAAFDGAVVLASSSDQLERAARTQLSSSIVDEPEFSQAWRSLGGEGLVAYIPGETIAELVEQGLVGATGADHLVDRLETVSSWVLTARVTDGGIRATAGMVFDGEPWMPLQAPTNELRELPLATIGAFAWSTGSDAYPQFLDDLEAAAGEEARDEWVSETRRIALDDLFEALDGGDGALVWVEHEDRDFERALEDDEGWSAPLGFFAEFRPDDPASAVDAAEGWLDEMEGQGEEVDIDRQDGALSGELEFGSDVSLGVRGDDQSTAFGFPSTVFEAFGDDIDSLSGSERYQSVTKALEAPVACFLDVERAVDMLGDIDEEVFDWDTEDRFPAIGCGLAADERTFRFEVFLAVEGA